MTGDPRHDRDLADRCIWDLIQHAGQWRRLGHLYAPDWPAFDRGKPIHEAVEKARRLGLVIEGDRQCGYNLTGFTMPVYIRTRPGRRP